MRKIWRSLPLLLPPLLNFLFSHCERKDTNPILALVGDTPITTQEFLSRYEFRTQAGSEGNLVDPSIQEQFKRTLLLEMIEEKLLTKACDEKGIQVEEKEVKSYLSSLIGEDTTALRRYLNDHYIPENPYLEELKKIVRIQKLFSILTETVTPPTEKELESYYQEHIGELISPTTIRLFHIYVKEEELAKKISAELERGVPFEHLARLYNPFPEGKRGGDMGYVQERDLPPLFHPAFLLPIGKPSRIYRSPIGYHIFLVKEKKPERKLSYKEIRDEIYNRLLEERKGKVIENFLQDLKKKVPIQIDEDAVEKVFQQIR
jgi:parvulin-like peptidyl-prolyl isomerase